ncbi:MAG TPA: two-component regulator propeller domain-containing protein [Puia sp.]|nr:two-component regulator propeller domain-containing protein [Puia sp.]
MRLEKTLLIIGYCLILNHVSAQPEEYLFSHVDVTFGLSNNHVTGIYKDARGFMWFGTVSGLNRYDGYQTRVFKHDPRDPHSIADNYIEQIFEGPGGKMWVESRKGRYNIYDVCQDRFDVDFGGYLRGLGLPIYELLTIAPSRSGYWFIYRDSGLFHYMPDGKIAAFRPGSRADGLSNLPVVTAREDGNGNCWVVHENGLIEEIDGRRNKVVFRLTMLENEFGNVPMTFCRLFVDAQNDLWLFSNGVFKGAYYYHPPTRALRHFALDAGERKLNSNMVLAALQDKKGLIWLGTDHGGVDIIDKRDFSSKFVGHVEDDNKSIAENSITTLYRDNRGTVWLGTYKSGVSYYHQDNFQFPQYRHEPNRPGTLPFEDVNSFAEDGSGNIWIGANGGGLLYFDRKKNSFHQWLHDPRNPNSLCSNIIVSLLLDKEGKLWIGTYFGGLDCFDGQRFVHYRHDDNDPYSLADDRVMCLCEDGDGQLWVGTLAAGMDRLDRRRKVFYHYRANLPNSIHNDYVSSIITDAQDNLWIGTGYGIDVIEKNTGNIRHYSVDYNQLSSDNVTWLYMDSKQRLWAATREGLDVLCPDEKAFQVFTTEDGLPDNTIRDIEEDSVGRLWVSTANGLSRISVVPAGDRSGLRIRCRNFHEQDGLQGREFNERTGIVTRDGSLLFGGPNGFNMFRPEDITPGRKTPPIVLTGLEVFDKSIRVGDQMAGHTILQKALTETGEITLTHHDNVFSIEFASLGYIPNATNRYAYKLEGFSRNWLITDGKIRKATYTNLDAGDYTFRVKASDEDGEWYDKEATLRITVLPPWWRTPLAYTVYVLLLAGALLLARWMVLQRAKSRFALENERRETRRMHEMDLMKIRFFTNMSHELRTPLSLILAPVDKLINQSPQSDNRRQYDMIRRNARRLLHLVNQLLDFRKMEEGELKLHLREGDVIRFVKDISLSFVDLAERKNIRFTYNEEGGSLLTRWDHDKLERILFNLLSNAFKFTPENGAVTVTVKTERPGSPAAAGRNGEEEVLLSIAIADTGIGIEPDKQEKIFERFFQNDIPDTILNQGSGIGLSITQEFVRMHNGRLSVRSELDKGSCFTVTLPLREIKAPVSPWAEGSEWDERAGEHEVPKLLQPVVGGVNGTKGARADSAPKGAPTILIVEDNEDFRFYLKDNLRAHYKIIEASDGKEGWKKVLAEQPQLVVSDISMPHMDGIQLCRKIRTDERTAQIPVILLTAMSGETVELEGLHTGATDYISKPFNFEVLLSRIRNAVEYTETVRKTWQRRVETAPAPVEASSGDEVFLREVMAYIEKNIGDPDLSVEAMSQQFHTSRSTFYKRVLLLTGKTPVEFIRHLRLQRAAELLEKSQLTVAEIAYTVGFNNPKYFTQYFKSAFDCIPSAYRQDKKMAGQRDR